MTDAERGVDAKINVTLGRVLGAVDNHCGVTGPDGEPDVGADREQLKDHIQDYCRDCQHGSNRLDVVCVNVFLHLFKTSYVSFSVKLLFLLIKQN